MITGNEEILDSAAKALATCFRAMLVCARREDKNYRKGEGAASQMQRDPVCGLGVGAAARARSDTPPLQPSSTARMVRALKIEEKSLEDYTYSK